MQAIFILNILMCIVNQNIWLTLLEWPWRSFEGHIILNFFSNCFILFLSFSFCLTIALIWFLSIRYTIESTQFCYSVTSLKNIEILGILKERLFQGHLSFELQTLCHLLGFFQL